MNIKEELQDLAISAAKAACEEILAVYNAGDFQAEAKGDNSPLTLADKKAHHRISEILQSAGFPILSEEGKQTPYEERRQWEYFWMVDPLDGTKEFLKRNGEFTVNIALINKGESIMGVVAVPVTGEIFYATKGFGAFVRRGDQVSKLPPRRAIDLSKPGLRVVASRSHMNEDTEKFISKLVSPTMVSKGSSLKFMLLAEDHADVYPRFAPTMEWDTAAAHAIVTEIGLKVKRTDDDAELVYNKPDLLNPYFLVS